MIEHESTSSRGRSSAIGGQRLVLCRSLAVESMRFSGTAACVKFLVGSAYVLLHSLRSFLTKLHLLRFADVLLDAVA